MKFAALMGLLAWSLPALSQPAPPTQTPMPRIDRVQFDGFVDADEWDAIPELPLVQYQPTFGGPMTVRSELRIAFDDDFIYLAARCFDTEPALMTTYKRDGWSSSDDQVALTIDSFNDSETASVFVLYATEARIDAQVGDDARTMASVNSDWNTFWDGRVQRTADGWEAEIRVPISSIRFETPSDGGAVTMGVSAYRYRARGRELHIYPEIRPDWGFWSFVKPSKGERRTFQGMDSSKPFYVTPYVIAGLGQQYLLNDSETEYQRLDDPSYDVGLDLKYSLTSNLTLDITANTDFAQVEADNQQVNLTRFSLFFPEKRQFFLERTSNFEFNFGGNDRVFYSRRIGLSGGQQVRLLGGGRVVGRIGGWDVGMLTLQSGRDAGRESENFGVLRVKRRVLNANSYLGAIATSRIDRSGNHNLVYGADAQWNIRGDDYLTAAFAQSLDSDGAASPLDASRIRVRLQRVRETGLAYDLDLGRAGKSYNPASGFQSRSDFSQVAAGAGFGVRPDADSPITSYRVSGSGQLFYRNQDGSLETGQGNVVARAAARSGWNGDITVNYTRDQLLDGFKLSDRARVPAGTFQFVSARAQVGTPSDAPIRGQANVRAGRFYDGRQLVLNLSPEWSLSPRLLVSASYQYNDIRFDHRSESFKAHLLSMRSDIMVNTKLTLSTFVQFSSASEAVIANARFRYNPREGNDLYLVWNEAINTNRLLDSPSLPFTSRRALILKYSYTFIR